MRITSGIFRSRQIRAPAGIRPTLDNVRKAIFDILGETVKDSRILDLYAGSGAFGLEALSRGALSCVFIDNSRASVKAIRDNIALLGLCEDGDISVLLADGMDAVIKFSNMNIFDIVFIDPPYYRSLAKKSLSLLGSYDILTKIGFVIVEHSKHDDLPDSAGSLNLFRRAKYGDTVISFYRETDKNS